MESSNLFATYKRLLAYTRSRWKFLVLAIVGMVLFSLTNTALVALLKPLLDENLLTQDLEDITFWGTSLLIVGILILRGTGNYLSVYYVGYVGNWVVKDLRSEMMEHLLNLPTTYFDTNPHGNILSRFTYDCEQVSTLASKALMYAVRDGLTIVAILCWLFYLNPLLSAIIFLIAFPIAYVMKFANYRFRKFAQKTQRLYGDISTNLQHVIRANTSVKAANAQAHEYREFEYNNEQLRRKKMRTVQTRAVNVPIVMILAGLSLVVIVYFAKADVSMATMSVGTLVSFTAAIILLFRPLRNIASLNAVLQQGLTAADSIFKFLDETRETLHGEQIDKRFSGHIVFRKVSFHYPGIDASALRDVDLEISAGETVALVGHSGAGKTSLANLLPRLYLPTRGCIEIDGKDINTVDLHDLRNQIAYVGQRTTLTRGSIADNIAYGVSAEREEIKAAASAAHATEFIGRLPQGFDTLVTDDLLSGGEIQRLAIARALLRDAPILIFDEATSSLDNVSEKQIKVALRESTKGRTVIIIAHRFSTIDFVKKIVVLDRGRIVGINDHAALLKDCPVYQRLYSGQLTDSLIP